MDKIEKKDRIKIIRYVEARYDARILKNYRKIEKIS